MLPDTSDNTVLPSVKPPLKLIVPVLVTLIAAFVVVSDTGELKVIVPVETEIVWVLVAAMLTLPATVSVWAPTARVMLTALALGLIDKLPVVPLTTRLPPAPMVSVVAVAVALPIVSDPQTAAVPIVRFTPELITASSLEVGTCPRLQVAPAQVVPALAVLVAAIALEFQYRMMSGKAAHRIRIRLFGIDTVTSLNQFLLADGGSLFDESVRSRPFREVPKRSNSRESLDVMVK